MLLDYGKSEFDIANSKVEDGFLREQGIESTELINSLGIFAISLPFMALAVGLYFIIKACSKQFKCCDRILHYIAGKIFYSSPIRYVILGQLKLFNQFASFLIFGLAIQESSYLIVGYSVPTMLLVAWPFFTVWFLLKNQSRLTEDAFYRKFN